MHTLTRLYNNCSVKKYLGQQLTIATCIHLLSWKNHPNLSFSTENHDENLVKAASARDCTEVCKKLVFSSYHYYQLHVREYYLSHIILFPYLVYKCLVFQYVLKKAAELKVATKNPSATRR